MKFFTDEAFRNKLIGLLGVLVLFLSQNYVEEAIGSKNAYKDNLLRTFELCVREMETLDVYLTSLKELNSIEEIKPVYMEDSFMSLLEYNRSILISMTGSIKSDYFYDAVFEYEKVNKNLDLIRADKKVSDSELAYINDLYNFNKESMDYAKNLINHTNYKERKEIEKNIFEIYEEYTEFLGSAYGKYDFKNVIISDMEGAKKVNVSKESVRDELEIISKRVTGLDTLSYSEEPYTDDSYCWPFTTKKDPKALDRSDEDVYKFDYIVDENKVNFYQSVKVYNDSEIKLEENDLKALADEHIKKLGLKVEFASSEKNKYEYVEEEKSEYDYIIFYYHNNHNDIYNEAKTVKVIVEKSGRLESTFSLLSNEPEISWVDENLIKEKFNNKKKIKSIMKLINSRSEGEYLVVIGEKNKNYIFVYDAENAKLKNLDEFDEDGESFYSSILKKEL